MKLNTITQLLLILSLYSCTSLESGCEDFRDGSYSRSVDVVDSEAIKLMGLPMETDLQRVRDLFGEELSSRQLSLQGKMIEQYYFSYKGAYLAYKLDETGCKLSYVEYVDASIDIDFEGLRLNSETHIREIKSKFPRAFCNSVYYEQRDRFEVYFKGSNGECRYTLVFTNNRLSGMDVTWIVPYPK